MVDGPSDTLVMLTYIEKRQADCMAGHSVLNRQPICFWLRFIQSEWPPCKVTIYRLPSVALRCGAAWRDWTIFSLLSRGITEAATARTLAACKSLLLFD